MKKALKITGAFLILILLALAFLYERDLSIEEAMSVLADDRSSFVEIEEMRVHYKREGNGFPVVLIHGTGAMLQTWDEWARILAEQNYELIRMDLQSFGLTGPRPDGDYSIDSYVDFLEQFIDEMELDSFHLVGNSLGGNIVWHYAVNHQDKIGKMVLIAPSGFQTEDKEGSLAFELAKRKWLGNILKNLGTSFFVRKTLEDVYYDDSKITEKTYQQYLAASKRAGNREAFIQRLRTEQQAETGQLSNIHTPTLLMWGDQDVLVPHHLSARFAAALPHDTLIVYPDVGHIPMEEIPEQSAKDALDFFKR
jgi:pimeloyl-ACP methyl ester carboxylesterase